MPQSNHDRTAELHNIPEHAAESAATHVEKAPHLSAHEETVKSEEQVHNTAEATTLHHGKAASIAAAKSKE